MDLCSKYGGLPAIHKIIYELYLDLFDRPEISHHFIGVDPFRLSELQAQFVCRALGAKVKYQGRPLYPVHKHLNVSQFQMDEVLKAFEEIFLKNGFAPKDVRHILRVLKRYAPLIVKCKLSWIDRVMILIYRLWDRVLLLF